MSAILEQTANASVAIEYKGKIRYGRTPHWIRDKQLHSYYNSIGAFYSECLEELALPKRFSKKETYEILMNQVRELIKSDKDFAGLIVRLIQNCPRFPMDVKSASEYLVALKALNRRVALTGSKLNDEIALSSLGSDVPYVIFSNLYLGNYAVSYFHEYKAKLTEQHFRRNYLLASGRMNVPAKKYAIRNYYMMIEPVEEMFKAVMKTQFKLLLTMILSNSEDTREFLAGPHSLSLGRIDQECFNRLSGEYVDSLEEFRRQLFQLEPALFSPIQVDKPTQTMWRDMVLVRVTE